jgi:DNA mismatch endonuclease (patch repair protein)
VLISPRRVDSLGGWRRTEGSSGGMTMNHESTDEVNLQIAKMAIDVHSALGPKPLNSEYEGYLRRELSPRHTAFVRELPLPVEYDHPMGQIVLCDASEISLDFPRRRHTFFVIYLDEGVFTGLDRISGEARSKNRSRIRSRHTTPELRVRLMLRSAGVRYRLHRKDLPGTPDIVLSPYRIVVFVHGCFWHGHSCARGHVSRSNLAYWEAKITRNRQRHQRAARELRMRGWSVWVIWECSIEKGARRVLHKIAREIVHINSC